MDPRITAHIDCIQEAIEAVGLDPEQISAALDWLKQPTTIDDLCREMGLDPDEAEVLTALYHGRMAEAEGGTR